jgi:hypothetical protein
LVDLPRYLVLEPTSTVRIDMHLDSPACEIDVALDHPRPGRSFVLLIGNPHGPFVQRVRLSGRARIHFDPEAPGDYVLLFANPQRDPVVLRLKVKPTGKPRSRFSARLKRATAGEGRAPRSGRREADGPVRKVRP